MPDMAQVGVRRGGGELAGAPRPRPGAGNQPAACTGPLQYIGQAAAGAPWDLVMVDGWSRLKCLLEGMRYVKPGGMLVLDNANQKQFDSVPGVMQQWERHKFRGLGVARSWVTQTDAYVRPARDVATVSASGGAGVAAV